MIKKHLEVKNLSIYFGEESSITRAVNDVSFDLRVGETIGIVGESGSGKSLTALAIMSLLPASARWEKGEVLLWNQDKDPIQLNTLPAHKRRTFNGGQLGMVFQEPMSSLNPVFTCGDQVAETLRYHHGLTVNKAKEITLDLFEKVRLTDPQRIYSSYPHQLSGGQKQRVMIAMALSCGPKIIICDEPTTALDVSIQKGILELLSELKKDSHTSFIFISHDLGVIAQVADRVLVLYEGEIVEEGSVTQVFSHPRHPYTQGLLACRPRLDMKTKRLPVLADFMPEQKNNEDPVKEKKTETVSHAIVGVNRKEPAAPLVVQVKDLKVWYPGGSSRFGRSAYPIRAVDGVSFDLYSGEILGLVGESGSGKTTLGKALVRLAPITEGTIYYKQEAIHHLEGKKLRDLYKAVQMIFQDPYGSLNPRMRIGEALMEPMQTFQLYSSKDECRQRAKQLLDLVRLPVASFNRYPNEFSGGQRQRIGIARALAVEPEFLICDESVSSLDVSIQAQILNLLLDLREELGLTLLFISHDLSVVKFISDRMLVMKDGKIVEQGKPDDIYQFPQSEYTRQLIEAIPSL